MIYSNWIQFSNKRVVVPKIKKSKTQLYFLFFKDKIEIGDNVKGIRILN